MLARTLIRQPDLLLLDEPTTGLDVDIQVQFFELLQNLRDKGIAIICVSHQIWQVSEFSSHILLLNNRKSYFGTSSDILESNEFKDTFPVKRLGL